ncbi:MAG: hypothetical protein ACJZ9G_01105 [Rhodospirillales bacterium]
MKIPHAGPAIKSSAPPIVGPSKIPSVLDVAVSLTPLSNCLSPSIT